MVSKQELKKMIEKKQAISERNYQNYQETGEQRYYRTYSQAEDLITIFRVAMDAADEHQKLISLTCEMATVRAKCERALSGKPDLAEDILRSIIAICRIYHI